MNHVNQNLILGALTADAASLGLHWIYNQQCIIDVAGKMPEFHPPTASDYEGVPSFYAHGKKAVGDLSHYGEQAYVLLKTLSDNQGVYHSAQYQEHFKTHFGYGGDYIGYIDRPTKDTLDSITITEHHALQQANSLAFKHDNEAKQNSINFTINQLKQNNQLDSNELKKKIDSEYKLNFDSQYLKQLIDCLKPIVSFHGADDVQLPAISKLPALAAVYATQTELAKFSESAIRVTNNNDQAVAYGQIASKMMEAAITTQDIDKVIEAAKQAAPADILLLINNALKATDKTTPEFTRQIGMSCNLELGIPSVIHNLNKHLSYQKSIRQNIIAGGDSCGRSILLGAILGAVHGCDTERGIPTTWLNRLKQGQRIEQLLDQL